MSKSNKTVLATGVFDILHSAHIEFLKRAKKQGDTLVVGIESDKRVKELKGESRPVNNQKERLKNLKKLEIADKIFILPKNFGKEQQILKFLKKINPDILAVSENTAYIKSKKKLMQKIDGKVKIVYPHQPQISTTKLLTKK